MANYPEKVLLNGKIVATEDAMVSVFDRGFIFGDGIYEVLLQMNGHFFYGTEHLNRLANCLKKISIDFDCEQLPETIDKLLFASKLAKKDCLIYIQITRGVAPRKHAFPEKAVPTLMIYALPFTLPEINIKPISVITTEDFRWQRCDIKMISLLGNVMANDAAVAIGNYETVLYRNDIVTEASHSNIFFVKDEVVYTHPANEFILNGITRKIVIQLCKDHKIVFKENAISKSDINKMDEAFLTGTSTQIASIRKIDDHSYYSGNEIPKITKKLQDAFLELKNNYTS